MSPPPAAPVRQRSVFLIGGYEPKSSDAFFTRTRRELARFSQTWQVPTAMQQQTLSDDGLIATARVDSQVDGKPVTSHINFCVWNDIVLRDFSLPVVARVFKYLFTVLDYALSGTLLRIVGQAWRFSLYFLYPLCMLGLISLIAAASGMLVARLALPGAIPIAVVIGLGVWYGLLRLSGRRWFVLHLMDLWSFSRGYLRNQRGDARALLDRFASAVVQRARTELDDEIVLVGHSTGGALILDIAATAVEQYPQLGMRGAKVTVLTVGSTALKIGLHPAAVEFRRRVQRLVDAPAVDWIECQAKTDVINFYKTDPVLAMRLDCSRSKTFPHVHLIRVRDMLLPDVYRRFKYNFFRVHYQFIMANTRRYAYDFFLMCCGPKTFAEQLGSELLWQGRAADPAAMDRQPLPLYENSRCQMESRAA